MPDEGHQLLASEFVFEFMEFVQRELFAVNGFGEEPRVMSLLPAEAKLAHFSSGSLRKRPGVNGLTAS